MKIEPTDLRSITRHPDRCLTTVSLQVDWKTKLEWLRFGEANIQYFEKRKTWSLKAYLPAGATDFEHDSAHALQLPLIGLQFGDLTIHYHTIFLVAWVDPNEFDGFRIPRPGYDPMNLPGATKCNSKECRKTPHIIVPEGHYAGPPKDLELFRAVAGKRVEICIGPVFPEEV